jgi:beta-galactosidase
VHWFGRGPFENYSDRSQAASIGHYSNEVADHYVPYLRPQENGYKTGTRWVALDNGADMGILVVADDDIGFGVHHNRQEDFVPRDLVSLNIDYGQMGVGGDGYWGKRTLSKYSLTELQYGYGFTLVPYDPSDGGLNRLTRR